MTHTTTNHAAHDDGTDDRYLVRNPRQIRQLLQALIDQRSLINAHLGGRDQSFPTAILELDEDEDMAAAGRQSVRAGEPGGGRGRASAVLRAAGQGDGPVPAGPSGAGRRQTDHVAFRVAFPSELVHLQRRELYRLETPITDSPHVLFPVNEDRSEALSLRVVDISGGGLAVTVPAGLQCVRAAEAL